MAELNTDVRFVRGVGEARAKSLAKLGITDLKSLISYFPRAYEDRRESRRIAELQVGERACVTAMVASERDWSSSSCAWWMRAPRWS